MFANVLKIGLGFAAGLALTSDTRKKVGEAFRAVGKDYGDAVKREVADLKRFYREEVKPLFEDEPRGNGPKPPTASA